MSSFENAFKGFGLTAKSIFKKDLTRRYPAEPAVVQDRFHGRHQLNRHADGLEKCVGCELCAWACPADAIFVRGGENTAEARYSPGERYGAEYQINYSRCIFCGLCIEACPTRALTMTNEFELSEYDRNDLVYTKDRLLAPVPEGGKATPMTDADVEQSNVEYYQHNFAGQGPTIKANDHYEAARHRTAKSKDALEAGAPLPVPQPSEMDMASEGEVIA